MFCFPSTASSTAVSSNQIWFASNEILSSGSRSKSAPMPIKLTPGLVKFDCPGSSCDRIELKNEFFRLRLILLPINGSSWWMKKLESVPAKTGLWKIPSKPLEVSSNGSSSPEACKPENRSLNQSKSMDISPARNSALTSVFESTNKLFDSFPRT